MSIYYDMHRTQNPSNPEAEEYKAKAVITNTVDLALLSEEISERSSFTVGDVKGLVTELVYSIKSHLADSHRVRIDGLGSFEVHLSSAPQSKGARMTSSKVIIKGITFRLCKTFMKHWKYRVMSCPASLKAKSKRKYTEAERRTIIERLFQREVVITRKEYQMATQLSKTVASRDIKTYLEEGWLVKKGRGTNTMYYLKK